MALSQDTDRNEDQSNTEAGSLESVVLEIARYEPEEAARIRALVNDGRIAVGSPLHCKLIDWEIDITTLSPRDQQIIRLSIRGWTTASIADRFGLGRERVDTIIREFF